MFKEYGFTEILKDKVFEKVEGNKIIEITKIDDVYSMNKILLMHDDLTIKNVVIDRLRSVTLEEMKEVLERYK